MHKKPCSSPRCAAVLLTSENGSKCAGQQNIRFAAGGPERNVAVHVDPAAIRQTIDGIGTSFTESAAFVLAHLAPEERRRLMQRIFGAEHANFTLCRTHIGSCDFCVVGKRSCADVSNDKNLDHFTIDADMDGFDPALYPGIKDFQYDLLPMILEAQEIKAAQADEDLRIIASAWTAPPWMKDNNAWYEPGSVENNWKGYGGSLQQEHYRTYARYLVKYLKAYQDQGIQIWGLTPVNEPCGNNGQWESLHFTPNQQNDFVKNHLGPQLQAQGFAGVKLLVYDQNRDRMEEWAETLFADSETAPYCFGIAVHWYSSTFRVYEDVFTRVHARFPEKRIIHTEGCIDDLGRDAPAGIGDPAGFKESGWFGNDAFWWNANATDWAYTSDWEGVDPEDHPIYTPVHRYARDIIVGLNNWLNGWVDWNIVLDRDGGPNHAGNFCGAPIMIDTATGEIHYTPLFYILSQLSRTIRPGDRAVTCEVKRGSVGADDLHGCATLNRDNLLAVQLLNTTKEPLQLSLHVEGRVADVMLPANALMTIQVQLQ